MSVNQNSRPNLKRPRRVQDLLLARKSARITAPPLFILGELPTDERLLCWENQNSDPSYLTVTSSGDLRVVNGFPGLFYGPNLFKLGKGSQGGRYVIYSFGMISESPMALAVRKDGPSANYVIYFTDVSSQSSTSDYEWMFQRRQDGRYSIRWCNGSCDSPTALSKEGSILNVNGKGDLFLCKFDRAA